MFMVLVALMEYKYYVPTEVHGSSPAWEQKKKSEN